MEAIILAGGFGTRLRSVVSDVPKPMAPVGGRPFLEIILRQLACNGFNRVVLSVGYLAEIVIAHFGKSFEGIELIYEVEKDPLGTGGAVLSGLKHSLEDHVFVFNGDTYLDLEISKVEAIWQSHKEPVIVAREVEDTARYGRLLIEGEQVKGFVEKGVTGPGLINAGCYVLPVGLIEAAGLVAPFSLEADYLDAQVKREPFRVFVTDGMFIDIGVPEDYLRAQTDLVGR